MADPMRSGKEAIFEAAADRFRSRPYSQVGVAEILDAAGVKAPTLYYHFGDKEALYTLWATTALEELNLLTDSAIRRPIDPVEVLIELAEIVGESIALDWLMVLDGLADIKSTDNKRKIERAFHAAVYEPVCLAIMRAQDEGRIRVDDLASAASTFLYTSRSAGSRGRLPIQTGDFRTCVLRYVYGFVRPLP